MIPYSRQDVSEEDIRAVCDVLRSDFLTQGPTIDAMTKDPAFAKLLILRLDYDNQSAEKRALGIVTQSTLIAFHGNKETGRSVGITDPDQIKSLAQSALH